MEDILNMTPEQKKQLERDAAKQFAKFVGIKLAVTVGTVVAIKALGRHLEKVEQKAAKLK
jgi:hypothetical protein